MNNAFEQWEAMAQAYRAKQLDQAESIGKKLIEAEPRHVKALHLLSVIAYIKKRPDQELQYLRRVIEVDPEHAEALNGAANLLRAKGSLEEAVRLLRRALQHKPAYANAHNSLGLCQIALKFPAEAAKSFQRAVDLDPSLDAAKQNLKVALAQVAKLTPHLRASVLAPSTAEDFEYLAHIHLEKKCRREAIAFYRQALELDPSSVRLLIRLADNERQHGLTTDALAHLQRALEIDPNQSGAHAQMGFAFQDLGEFDRATAEFENSIALRPIQGASYLGLVTTRKLSKDDAPLVERIASVLAESDMRPSERMFLHTALSKARDDLGEYESAVKHMDEANRLALTEIGSALGFSQEAIEQEVDQSIKVFTKDFFKRRKDMGTQTELPVLFVGLPRSGTTLLEQILSAHPKVAAGGEIRFWRDEAVTKQNGLTGIAYEPDEPLQLASKYAQLLKSIGPLAERVTDKMPDNFFYIGFIHMLFPNARFIHCRRNPMDNCVSLYMTPFRNRPNISYRREDIVCYYRVYRKMMDHWQRVIPADRILEVNYEDVVADRESATRKVLNFLNLDWDDACLRHEDVSRVVNTPSNWQSRQKIYGSSVERWLRYEPWLGALTQLRPESETTD